MDWNCAKYEDTIHLSHKLYGYVSILALHVGGGGGGQYASFYIGWIRHFPIFSEILSLANPYQSNHIPCDRLFLSSVQNVLPLLYLFVDFVFGRLDQNVHRNSSFVPELPILAFLFPYLSPSSSPIPHSFSPPFLPSLSHSHNPLFVQYITLCLPLSL